ncbi:MAG: GTP cyclohydrolase II [Pseudomonadota bacterium]
MKMSAVTSAPLEIDWSAQTVLPIDFHGREVSLEARAYQGDEPHKEAFVLINRAGPENKDALPLVRVHSGCVTGDIFHSLRCDCYAQLQAALERIVDEPNGVLVYLAYHEGRGIGLVNKIKAYALQDQGFDTVDANVKIGAPIDARDYDLAAAILFDLGFGRVRLLSNNPAKVEALAAQGVKVVEQVSVVTPPHRHNERYLATKKKRMAHKL